LEAESNLRSSVFSVGFQGERGAYSEIAIYTHFNRENVRVIPFEDLVGVFDATANGKIDFGLVPIENSLAGSIGETFDLLLNFDVAISGEVSIPIAHCVIANKESELSNIKRVYSHPQALAQCRKFLSKVKWEQIPTYDTAGSVKIVKDLCSKENAAIASEIASEVYDMKILAKDIADEPSNQTRFLIISKNQKMVKTSSNNKTSVIFSTKHSPGALVKALNSLSSHGVNLDKVESRPIKTKPWEYFFYVDFDGHITDENVVKALKELKRNSESLKILGSYPKIVF
jgi:prephenate dehydratase